MERINLTPIKKGVKWFVGLTICTITFILIFTVRKETIQSLKSVNLNLFLLAGGVALFRIYLECLRLQILTKAFKKWLPFQRSVEFTVGGYFLSITPFGGGGLPLQLYILHRENFSIGEGGGVISMRGVTWLIGVGLILPIIMKYTKGIEMKGSYFIGKYLCVVYGLFFLLFLLVMLRTKKVKQRLTRWSEFFANKGKKQVANFISKLSVEIEKFKSSLSTCWRRGSILSLVLSICVSIISLLIYGMISGIIFMGLGVEGCFVEATFIQIVLTFLLMFVPTPGGAGIAEGVGFSLYKEICGKPELIGVYVILWRVFTYYIGVILGGVILLKMVFKK